MSEELQSALISGALGLVGVVLGAILSYLLQIRVQKIQMKVQRDQETREALLAGVEKFAKEMRTKGTYLTIVKVASRGADAISSLGWIFMLVLMFIAILIVLVPTLRRYFLSAMFTTPSWILIVIAALVGLTIGWALFKDVLQKKILR